MTTYLRTFAFFAAAMVVCWFGGWWIVAIGCMTALLIWLRDNGPDDPPVTTLRRRQLDTVVERQKVRR